MDKGGSKFPLLHLYLDLNLSLLSKYPQTRLDVQTSPIRFGKTFFLLQFLDLRIKQIRNDIFQQPNILLLLRALGGGGP